MVNFEGEKGPAQDKDQATQQEQHRYSVDADWGFQDGGLHIGATAPPCEYD